jgi:hypothetical protein
MKKLITILVAALLTTAAIPQSTAVEKKKTVICDDTKTMYNELVNEYSERPVWGGDGENSKFVLLINKKTGTWTFIEFVKDTSCVLGVGEGSLILDLEKKKPSL